jgi:serine protease inhibitor
MLAETADGSTREQILRTLRAESPEALRERAGALWAANTADTPVLTSKLANSLWLRNDIGYNEDTLHRLASDYCAASFRGVMGSPEMNAALQSWTDEHTGGLLSDYVSGLSLQKQTVLALISTIYYKAAWTEKFSESETGREVFHGTAGDAEAEMMHSTQGMGIYRREKFSAISLDLNDSGEMFFFLPEEGVTPEEIITDPAMFNVLRHGDGLNIPYALVRMTIPKFTVRERTDLREKLEALGITDALSAETADFSPLTDEAEGVFLSRAEHAAMVEIDEEGVTGAAYTALMLDGAAAMQPEPVDFVLDRPFCFVVTGLDGSILFAGIVNNIE